jgi:phospholipid/cholesterol/gamma-HCH transport system permease protein
VYISLGALFSFLKSVIYAFSVDRPLRRHDVRRVIVRQVYFTGVEAMRLVSLFAVILGVLAISQSVMQLKKWGGSEAMGPILVGLFLRELGPLITILIVIARSVTAVASELAAMKASGEIDALRCTGVSPLSYLVVPRVVAGAISTFFLAVYFVGISLFVGYLAVQGIADMSFEKYALSFFNAIQEWDIIIFTLKTMGLGWLLFLGACFCGLRTGGANYEIPRATTRAVMWSFMMALGVQVFLSATYYLYQLQNKGWLKWL